MLVTTLVTGYNCFISIFFKVFFGTNILFSSICRNCNWFQFGKKSVELGHFITEIAVFGLQQALVPGQRGELCRKSVDLTSAVANFILCHGAAFSQSSHFGVDL